MRTLLFYYVPRWVIKHLDLLVWDLAFLNAFRVHFLQNYVFYLRE